MPFDIAVLPICAVTQNTCFYRRKTGSVLLCKAVPLVHALPLSYKLTLCYVTHGWLDSWKYHFSFSVVQQPLPVEDAWETLYEKGVSDTFCFYFNPKLSVYFLWPITLTLLGYVEILKTHRGGDAVAKEHIQWWSSLGWQYPKAEHDIVAHLWYSSGHSSSSYKAMYWIMVSPIKWMYLILINFQMC